MSPYCSASLFVVVKCLFECFVYGSQCLAHTYGFGYVFFARNNSLFDNYCNDVSTQRCCVHENVDVTISVVYVVCAVAVAVACVCVCGSVFVFVFV